MEPTAMHLNDAMIDIKTGNPIVAGEIVLALGKAPPISMPAHSHLLLDFERRPVSTLICRAVTAMKWLENGFYSVTTAEPHFSLQPFCRRSFESYLNREGGSRTAFQGPSCGSFYRADHHLFDVAGSALVRGLQASGMGFRITGAFAAAGGPNAIALPVGDAGFEISGLIGWAVLRLYGFAGRYHQSDFVPEPAEPKRERIDSRDLADPLALADLLLDREGPLVGGKLTLSSAAPRARQAATARIVALRWDGSGLRLASCSHVERETDGFCIAMGKQQERFSSMPITLPWIEQLLRKADRATICLSGDGIGEVAYETGGLVEMGLREIISIDAERIECAAALSPAGLHLKLDAGLSKIGRRSVGMDDFVTEPIGYPPHFSAVATLPWSHLLVMGSRLIERRARLQR
jgi:hypothetical protein